MPLREDLNKGTAYLGAGLGKYCHLWQMRLHKAIAVNDMLTAMYYYTQYNMTFRKYPSSILPLDWEPPEVLIRGEVLSLTPTDPAYRRTPWVMKKTPIIPGHGDDPSSHYPMTDIRRGEYDDVGMYTERVLRDDECYWLINTKLGSPVARYLTKELALELLRHDPSHLDPTTQGLNMSVVSNTQ